MNEYNNIKFIRCSNIYLFAVLREEVQEVDIIFIAIPACGKFHLSANCARTRTFVKPEC